MPAAVAGTAAGGSAQATRRRQRVSCERQVWRSRFRKPSGENRKLKKKLLAESMLDNAALEGMGRELKADLIKS
jgi:hypothetical protein